MTILSFSLQGEDICVVLQIYIAGSHRATELGL